MAAKLTRLTHKIAIQVYLVGGGAVPFTVLAPGGQSGKFWIHPRTFREIWWRVTSWRTTTDAVGVFLFHLGKCRIPPSLIGPVAENSGGLMKMKNRTF